MATNAIAKSVKLRWIETTANLGQRSLRQRTVPRTPSTSPAVSNSSETTPEARVRYQRAVPLPAASVIRDEPRRSMHGYRIAGFQRPQRQSRYGLQVGIVSDASCRLAGPVGNAYDRTVVSDQPGG